MKISLGYILGEDETSFKGLFNLYFPPLCVYASRYIGDPSSCEDIVQEAFAQLWAKKDRIVITGSLKNYLVSTVRNLCIDCLRKNSSHRRYVKTLPSAEEARSDYVPDEIYSKAEIEKMLDKALDSLPDSYRMVFEMNRIEGISYDEIARMMNISVRTAKRYKEHAQKSLENKLKDIGK